MKFKKKKKIKINKKSALYFRSEMHICLHRFDLETNVFL